MRVPGLEAQAATTATSRQPTPAAAPAIDRDVGPVATTLVDDGVPVGAGQAARGRFFAELAAELVSVCDADLARVGRSTDGCPYLATWLTYYRGRTAAELERAIRHYTGTTARDPDGLRRRWCVARAQRSGYGRRRVKSPASRLRSMGSR